MRTVSGMMLAAVIAFLVGCGKSDSPAPKDEPKTPLADPNKTEPGPGPTPPKDDPKKDDPKTGGPDPLPKSPLAGWEMDPAKHTIPTAPVTGSLGGAPFTPEAQIEGEALRFRTLKTGFADRQIELRLSDPGKALEGTKLTVRPDQPAGPGVPHVTVLKPGATEAQPDFKTFDRGYALTLEVGKRDKGKVPGKIYLSLPGDAKDYVFGTFTADRVRSPDEPPGPDDVPFVQGKVTVTGAADPYVSVGYVRVEPYDPAALPVVDLIGTTLTPGGFPARTEVNRPRVAVLIPGAKGKDPARFELTKLDPGRYWVFATLQGGPAVWKWLTVPADGKLTADFTLDAKAFGGLEVRAPGEMKRVSVVPAVEGGKAWTAAQAASAGSMVGLQAEPKPDAAKKDATAAFPRLSPGKYEVFGEDLAGAVLTGTVEVKAGATAKVELKKK